MQKNLPWIISLIFHPLIMTPIGMLLLFNSGIYLDFLSFQQKRAIFLMLLTGTTLLPLSIIPVLLLRKAVSGPAMETHRERVLPLLITSLFYIFTWFLMYRFRVPGLIIVYTVTAGLTVLICAIISLKWKISLHMTAMGALAGVLLALAFRFNINMHLYLSLVFLAGGATGWARLSLGAHTPEQVYAGYAGGLALAFFMISTF